MKIETRDMVAVPDPEPEPTSQVDPGLVRQAVLALMLACVLLVTLRWAINVTNANARQVSTNLTSIQDRIDGSWPDSHTAGNPAGSSHGHRRAKGPTIEPADDP